MELQKTRRRWFRFRLRTFLVMVTLLTVPLGWVGWELDQRRREKALVEEMGGHVNFLSSFPNDERNWLEKTKDKWLGERVLAVRLCRAHDLSPLAELKNLELLKLYAREVIDLSPLAELKNLKYLFLRATQVSDLSPLAELSNLRTLDLNGTHVSEEQLEELRQTLPHCEISF